MAPTITRAPELRLALTEGMRAGSWWSVPELYELVESQVILTDADRQPDVRGSSATRWQRNVRNVLQRGKRDPDPIFDWDAGAGRYRLLSATASGPGPVLALASERSSGRPAAAEGRSVRDPAVDSSTPSPGSEAGHIEALLRPRRRRPSLSFAQRRAIEQRAVDAVTELLTDEGWQVQDVGDTHSYDLHCTSDDQVLYVEVKGTTGPLGSIGLTANEVDLAVAYYPSTALFVVHGIVLAGDSITASASGGETLAVRPWRPDEGRLEPTAFRYELLAPS